MATKKSGGINPLTAGAVGAAIGAAIGIAAVELSDEKNRNAVGKKLGEIREEGEKVYAQLKETATETKGKVEDLASKAEGKMEEAKADINKKIKK